MTDLLSKLREKMSSLGINPQKGLGEDFFLFVSSLVPIVNVDLLVYNSSGEFILTRRNDSHCGVGWHIPGGCIRFKESFDTRIRKVAKEELGLVDFTYDKIPIKVFEIFSNQDRNIKNQDERAHFITLVFKCYAPESYKVFNGSKSEQDIGYIKWFDELPDDFLPMQECYKELLK